MKRKNIFSTIAILAATLIVAGCSGQTGESDSSAEADTVIRVGSKDFTENLVVSEIYALALEDAGYEVERIQNIASSVVHTSITNDEIDLYPEYTGTGLLVVLGMEMETDPQKVYDTIKAEYDEQFDLTWLDYAQANDSAGLVIKTSVAEKYGIETISDLQEHASELRMASQGEFDQREDGLPGLTKAYGEFNWKSSTVYDNSLKYEVLKNDEADVAPAYTTEGQLTNKEEFTVLVDDKKFWPPYNLAPVIRNEVLEANPDIAEILNKISSTLDTETVTDLNAKVDVDGQEYEAVAKEYFESIN